MRQHGCADNDIQPSGRSVLLVVSCNQLAHLLGQDGLQPAVDRAIPQIGIVSRLDRSHQGEQVDNRIRRRQGTQRLGLSDRVVPLRP